MKIRMLTIQAGPSCNRDIGKEYDVDPREGKALVAAGAAVAVERSIETAEKPAAPENAAKRTGKGRREKPAPAGDADA